MPSPFAVNFDETSSVLTVSGEIDDEFRAQELRDAIAERSGGFTKRLVVDLSDVTYLPSVAVGVLAKAQRQFDDESQLELVAAQGSIAQRVLVVCALPHRAP